MTCIDCGVDDPYRLCDPCRIRLLHRGILTAHAKGWPTVLDAPKKVGVKPDLASAAGIFDRTVCEGCPRPSMAGGRWCLPCFQKRANPIVRVTCGSSGGYDRHRRNGTQPCHACLVQHAIDDQYRRASA